MTRLFEESIEKILSAAEVPSEAVRVYVIVFVQPAGVKVQAKVVRVAEFYITS